MSNVEKKQNWWTRKKTSSKVLFIIGCILLIGFIAMFIVAMDLRTFLGDEIGDMVYGEGVLNGWVRLGQNLLFSIPSWVMTFIIVFAAFIIIFIGSFITHLFDYGSRRAKTIASLVRSLLKYVIIIAAVCFILIAWGVDVMGVVAGVGVITLIIGLGCQNLIQDVISGLFIVFDDYFASGDMVIIDGFRGTIVEVGLKSTKLEDVGGNIKSITNSSITTVVNMSRLKSIAKVVLPVSFNEDVERVEAIIVRECERLKEKVPNIIEGPYYKGVDGIGTSSVNLLVLCFCKESDRFQVTRDLNREFYLLFKRHNILIPYTQITVNPQDEHVRKKASEEQSSVSKETQDKLRGIGEKSPGKKKKLNKIIKDSYKKTKSDFDD